MRIQFLKSRGKDLSGVTVFVVFEKEQGRLFSGNIGSFYIDSRGAHVEIDGSNLDFPTLDHAKEALRKAYRQNLAIGYRLN